MKHFVLTEDPAAERYDELLRLAAQACDKFSMILRTGYVHTPTTDAFLRLAERHLLEERLVSKWHGTELLEPDATVALRVYALSSASLEILKSATRSLYGWEAPLPEDLALLRPDGRPWLYSITHERESYLELSEEEHHALLRVAPALGAMLRELTAVAQ